MILQKILFPQSRTDETKALYYSSNTRIQQLSRTSVRLPAECLLDLFSYFNAFSAARWGQFSVLNQVKLRAFLSGSGIIRFMYHTEQSSDLIEEHSFCSQDVVVYSFPVDLADRDGLYALKLWSRDGAILHEATFFSDCPPVNEIRIAAAACTFRREAYITANIEKIRREILENSDSPLYGRFRLFIIDNGRTLGRGIASHPDITLFPNANTGGSGGFTRGILEALHRQEDLSLTHVLLMDDDIDLETESLERTFALLSFLKKDLCDGVVGGAMLRNDTPCILEEAGANWPGRLESMGRGMDLSKKSALFRYNRIKNTEYQAWWYCCIPLSLAALDNLPLPFFIHGDDVEYGLRNFRHVLQLNGICVWHNTFENKRPSNLEYYDVRNHLILNSIYQNRISLFWQILGQFKRSTALILRMRYQDVLLNIRGIDDFLKGPKWWAAQDIETLHHEILKSGYEYLPFPDRNIFEQYYLDASAPVGKWMRLKCFLTLNGAFFPKKRRPAVVACGSNPFVLYRCKQAWLWDPASDKAIHVHFSLRQLLNMYFLLLKAFVRLCRGYLRAGRAYRQAYRLIGTERFWKRYLRPEETV